MTFISYAQNLEDVMLFRALRGVEKGFYIDVGAQDPVVDSVTKAFYERGWRGINIEPVEQWFQKLLKDRPEDINLRLVASSETGNVRFFEVRDTGMSTMNVDFARQHAAQGFEVQEHEIPAKPLDAICVEFTVKEVHFLKIDVEGAEAEVLRGIGLTDVRPWIIFVEATEPNSQVTTHEEWEHLLTSRGYEFAYFDGLNRFYIAQEQATLKSAFAIPPNYFDHYVRYSEWLANQQASRLVQQVNALNDRTARAEAERDVFAREAQQLQGQLGESRQEVQRLHGHLAESRQEANVLSERVRQAEAERDAFVRETNELRNQLAEESRVVAELQRTVEEMYKSLSMRITAPLRAAKRRFLLIVRASAGAWSYLVRLPEQALREVGSRAVRQPGLQRLARRLLARWPRVRWRIKRFLLMPAEEGAHRYRADHSGPPPVTISNRSAAAQTQGKHHSKDRVSQFAVIESMQAIVDCDALRTRIRSKTGYGENQQE